MPSVLGNTVALNHTGKNLAVGILFEKTLKAVFYNEQLALALCGLWVEISRRRG